ncbi:MAG: hypothetical protein KTR32_20105 [Granulosicoccus sp.]|nr:hypothetical protein [Granulosicoccus sp.]
MQNCHDAALATGNPRLVPLSPRYTRSHTTMLHNTRIQHASLGCQKYRDHNSLKTAVPPNSCNCWERVASWWRTARSVTILAVFVITTVGCVVPSVDPSADSTAEPAAVEIDNTESESNVAAKLESSVSEIDRAIILDHLSIIAQVFDPVSTTMQVTNNDNDARLRLFTSLLAAEGYGIQRVSADQGANYFSYSRKEMDDEGPDLIEFVTRIGTVEITRQYSHPSGSVVPASRFRLSGTRTPVQVDQAQIENVRIADTTLSTVSYIASMGLDEQAPIISLVTPEVVSQITEQSTGTPSIPAADPTEPTRQALNSSRVEVNNLFYADTSTFSSILSDFEKVKKMTVIFGNDSLVLGDTNKTLIGKFVDTNIRDGDIITLVGCSNGQTALEMGNEGLALGRARRVTEELMASGLSRDRILDEGCWAPVSAGEKFPARGVVIELWRRIA